jgi:hypothetical protein
MNSSYFVERGTIAPAGSALRKASKRLRFWTTALLTFAVCWSAGSAFAQNPKPNPAGQRARQALKPRKNNNPQSRENARNELAAAVAARAQNDPQFRLYIDAVNAHNAAVQQFVNSRKGGAR